MKLIRTITGSLLAILLVTPLSAQSYDCFIKKSFSSKEGKFITLSNKYGDINLITSKDDSIAVCVTISIEQENKQLVQKSIKLISINIDRKNDTVSVSTTFDKKFFSQTYREGRKSFSVDYLIKIPVDMSVRITNAFGNINLEELSGQLNARLSQGNLTVRKLSRDNTRPLNEIYVDHGKININECNWMNITARNCPSVEIGKARAILITSDFSKINLGEISSLVSFSKSDSYIIEAIKNIVSESIYSTFYIGELSGRLKSTATLGSIIISNLKKEFSLVDITADQAPISIVAGDGVSFKTDILAINTMVDFPLDDFPGIIRAESENSLTFVGIAGDNTQTISQVRIRQKSGKLTIR
jgi:hypothetical protein